LNPVPALRAALLAAPLAAVAFTLLISGAGGLGRCAGGHHLGPAAEGGFGSLFAWSETLTRAVPLILTGLAAAVAFRPGCSTSAPKASSTRRAGGGGGGRPARRHRPRAAHLVLFPLMMAAAALAGAACCWARR
jgi:simple sugar transport system permease protein